MTRKTFAKTLLMLIPLLLLGKGALAALQPIDDDQLAEITGQALFQANSEVANGFTFYRAGLDATLDLNLNVGTLELGRTDTGVDIYAENMALGCTSNGTACVDSDSATQLKPFSLLRPYLQFAIKNDGSPTQREIVGIRLGAENVSGPLSVGMFQSFSGYLTGTANIEMLGQYDVAATCDNAHAPCPGTAQSEGLCFGCSWTPRPPTSDGSTYYEENPGSNTNNCDPNCTPAFAQPETALGVKDDHECTLGLCVAFSQMTVEYLTQSKTGLPVEASGTRLTQASIYDMQLATLVDDIVATMQVVRPDGLSGALIDLVLPLLRSSVADKFKNQLAEGLGVTDVAGDGIHDDLDAYVMPYNVANFHRVDVNSSNFGLTFQKESVQYPGFATAMPAGWAMYMPDAFTLSISDKTSVFVNNIVSSSAARDGNIIGLDPVYDNCWGQATFC